MSIQSVEFRDDVSEPSAPSVLSSSLTLDSLEEEYPQQLQIDDVRIVPSYMLFENAYEGKEFKNKVVIQNCGKRLAFIRLGEPNSKTFEFRSFNQGLYLSPGMKIIRTVNFTYKSALGVKRGFAPIYVNGTATDYYFIVTLSKAILSIQPQQLDFGRIDAVNHATNRSFFIENSGTKGTQFAIDLGRNPLELIVEPMKGQIPAKTQVKITVEIVGSEEGEFMEEIWVKTQPPQRVVVSGVFMAPKLLVRKFINSLDFTLIDFQPTFYGSCSTQPLLIKNFSSSRSMFCVMAEIKGKTVTLDEARKIDDNYRNFVVRPIDGRIAALRGAIIQITFAPVKTRHKEKNYAACFLKVIRMDCRDADSAELSEISQTVRRTTTPSLASTSKDDFSTSDENNANFPSDQDDKDISADSFSFEHAIGVCLHGEKEQAEIVLRPTGITIADLTLGKTYDRELSMTNVSENHSVRVKYVKVASVDVLPAEFYLGPSQSTEVLVTVKAAKLGKIVRKISFDLLGHDVPNDSNVVRNVGSVSLKLEFGVKDVVAKQQLEQCVLCQNVPARLSSDLPYRINAAEWEHKMRNNAYYLGYIRSLKKPPPPIDENRQDYCLTNHKLLALENTVCQNPIRKAKKDVSLTPFIPLAPRQLYNIKITPKSIRLRKVAAYTSITESFQIENLNDFPIRILLHSSKPCIVFDDDSRYVIHTGEKKKIPFIFSTYSIGRYYVNIYVLVNDSTLYEVTAVARVVPKTLKLESTKIEFTEEDGNYKFFNLINGLNSHTSFDWDVPDGCFKIYPLEGGIRAESFLICLIMYTPDPSQPNVTECILTSESGQQTVVQISSKKRSHEVVLDTYEINVGVIPLNVEIRKKVCLKNLKHFKVLYTIVNNAVLPGIEINPSNGVIEGLDSQLFIVKFLMKAVVEFSTKIVFTVNDEEEIELFLKGAVEFPKFALKPDTLNFRKIAPYSVDVLAFQVKNLSTRPSCFYFPLDELPEFSITESEDIDYVPTEQIVLQPQQSKILFLHFHPNYVSTYSLYLPCVVNNVLGPVLMNSSVTTTPQHFIQEYIESYSEAKDVRVLKNIPKLMPSLRINCCAIDKTLEFSTLSIGLMYFGEDHYANYTCQDFEITNTGSETASVCIRIDDLAPPFALTPKEDTPNLEYYDVSYKIVLEAGETAVFQANFFPVDMDDYTVKLPIFLRHYYDNKIFNYLTLKGTYGTPTMIPSAEVFDFEPVPLRVSNEMHLTLRMLNHFRSCEVSTVCDLNGLFPIFEKGRNPASGDCVLDVTLSYEFMRTHCFATKLVFYCTCESKCEVTVSGVTENCLLTTHAFTFNLLKSIELTVDDKPSVVSLEKSSSYSMIRHKFFGGRINSNSTTYPLFPEPDDESDYAKYMRGLEKTLESWIYSQGFYLTGRYKIPEGFSDFCKTGEARRKMRFGGHRKSKTVELPLLQLMSNIVGPGIRHELPKKVPEDDDNINWLIYISKTNSSILRYIRGFAVYLPHVKSKYLLNYDQYVQYEQIKRPNSACLDEATFYRLSKQCWMDLILQIIKTFFLFRSIEIPGDEEALADIAFTQIKEGPSMSAISHLSTDEETSEHFLDLGAYGDNEKTLIMWLQECYDKEKSTLWDGRKLEDKNVMYFDHDLRDCLVLGAAIAHYCPYIKSLVRNMYTNPRNPEELLHNACVIVQIWQALRFSYEISPLDLLGGGMVQMLLVVTYLYVILPDCRPQQEITIQAPLTQTNFVSLELENLGHAVIVYRLVFFGNENNLFSVGSNDISIDPESKKIVKVRYHAKSVLTTTTTLLFSGETPGYKYGKSIAVTLVGVADVTYACMQIPLTVDLYKPCNVTINTESPFKVKANYSLYFGYQPPSKDQQNVLFPWDEVKQLKTIKEFFFQEDMCHFDEEGKCATTQLVCCQQVGPRNMWFYYTNPEVGDWGVQITMKGRVTNDNFEHIEVTVPQNYDSFVCRCQRKLSVIKNCPLILHVKIPMKNNLLWDAMKAMLLHYVEGAELKFWSKRIYTPTGTRILTLILNSETHPMGQVIVETVKYTVIVEKKGPFMTLKSVTFDDVTSEDFYDLPIHPTKDLLAAKQCTLQLVSADGVEKRYYKVHFVSETFSRQNVSGSESQQTTE